MVAWGPHRRRCPRALEMRTATARQEQRPGLKIKPPVEMEAILHGFNLSTLSSNALVIIWFVIPAVSTSSANHTHNTLSMIVLIKYIPRVFLIISLNSKIVKASGVVTRTAWAGAAYNLIVYTFG